MVELLPETAPSVEQVLSVWLSPLGRVGTRRKAGDPIPFRMIKRVAGPDRPDIASDDPTVSVHTFASSPEAAINESERTHRRMLVLARNPLTEITIPSAILGGTGLSGQVVVSVDYCIPRIKPVEVDYEDPGVIRYVARYDVGLSYITAP